MWCVSCMYMCMYTCIYTFVVYTCVFVYVHVCMCVVPRPLRDGSAVELVGLCYSAVNWLAKLHSQGIYPYSGVKLPSQEGRARPISLSPLPPPPPSLPPSPFLPPHPSLPSPSPSLHFPLFRILTLFLCNSLTPSFTSSHSSVLTPSLPPSLPLSLPPSLPPSSGAITAILSFTAWSKRLSTNFEDNFWIPGDRTIASEREGQESSYIHRTGIYKDTVGASQRYGDFQLRPNFPMAMTVAPELFTPQNAWLALQVVEELLLGPLGMRTLDPQ